MYYPVFVFLNQMLYGKRIGYEKLFLVKKIGKAINEKKKERKKKEGE